MPDRSRGEIATLSLLTLASEFIGTFTWTYEGPCTIEAPVSDTRHIAAAWNVAGSGIVSDRDRALWQMNAPSRYRERIIGTALTGPGGEWRVPYAYARSHNGDKTELQWLRMWHRVSEADVCATVLLIPTNVRIVFSDPLPVVQGVLGRHTNENGLLSKVFRRALLVRSVQLDNAAHLAIAYEGTPLGEDESVSLLTVLGLCLGEDLEVRAEITVGADGKAVGRTLFAVRDSVATDRRPALDALHPDSVRALNDNLATMVEQAHSLRSEHDVAIDVAVKYLQRWNMQQLDLEIRDITSALNVLIESPAFAPSRTTLLTQRAFELICQDIDATVERHNVPDDFRARLQERICEANAISSRERRRKFWDVVGFEPTPKERSALRRRHIMSHKGFIDPQDRAEERALLQDIDHARTLVNETILALLRYDGPVIAYGSRVRPMRSRSIAVTQLGES
jgi:hypothetical protein